MFSNKDLQKARRRDGAKDEERSEEIEELLTPNERVGFKEGKSLLGCPYSEVPRHDAVLKPSARDALADLLDHNLVTSIEDVAAELATDEAKIERALELHDLSAPTETFNVEVTTDRLSGLVDLPERMVAPDNSILVCTLYVDRGLSIEEIRDVIGEAADDNVTVHERAIRTVLIDAKVLQGETSAEAERRRRQSRGETNRPDTRGLSFSTSDI